MRFPGFLLTPYPGKLISEFFGPHVTLLAVPQIPHFFPPFSPSWDPTVHHCPQSLTLLPHHPGLSLLLWHSLSETLNITNCNFLSTLSLHLYNGCIWKNHSIWPMVSLEIHGLTSSRPQVLLIDTATVPWSSISPTVLGKRLTFPRLSHAPTPSPVNHLAPKLFRALTLSPDNFTPSLLVSPRPPNLPVPHPYSQARILLSISQRQQRKIEENIYLLPPPHLLFQASGQLLSLSSCSGGWTALQPTDKPLGKQRVTVLNPMKHMVY